MGTGTYSVLYSVYKESQEDGCGWCLEVHLGEL